MGYLVALVGLTGCAYLTYFSPPPPVKIFGTANYRERIPLPPQAVFEASIEDVTRTDVAPIVIASTKVQVSGQPPFPYSLDVDPQRVQPLNRYVLRGRIMVDGVQVFTNETTQPVLSAGSPKYVELPLRRQRASALGPMRRVRGMYTYAADTGVFVDCASGERWAVAPEGDSIALQSTYLATHRGAPGVEMLAMVDGRLQTRPVTDSLVQQTTLVVDRFLSVAANATCSQAARTAAVENTYWKLVMVLGRAVKQRTDQGEPHLILQPQQKRVVGSGGCNRFAGNYTIEGEALSFSRASGTLKNCQGVSQERSFFAALTEVARWRVDGQRLTLFDESGYMVAQFEAQQMQ